MLVQAALGLAVLLSLAGPLRTNVALYGFDVGVTLLAGILWWVWMHRAYCNIQALGHIPGHEAGRVVWSFLVPFANWVWPYQLMTEIWRKSSRFDDIDADDPLAPPPVFLPLWWGLWLLRSLSVYAVMGPTEAGTLIAFTAIDVLAAIAAIYVVRRVTERQEAAFSGSSDGTPQTF